MSLNINKSDDNKLFDMIVAADLNWGIGVDNRLLTSVKQDMDFFKQITLEHVVIMGRKTADSLPRGYLKGRTNIILSKTYENKIEPEIIDYETSIIKINSINKLLKYLNTKLLNKKPFIVIGGRSIYLEFLQRDLIDRVFLTTYLKKFNNVDTYIPDLLTLGFKYNLTNPYHIITGYELPKKAIINGRETEMEFTIHTLTI